MSEGQDVAARERLAPKWIQVAGTLAETGKTMSEDELREAIRCNFENRALQEGQFCAADDVAAEFPDSGMEEELLLGIIKHEMTRHRIRH